MKFTKNKDMRWRYESGDYRITKEPTRMCTYWHLTHKGKAVAMATRLSLAKEAAEAHAAKLKN
jgi:hypothetical protein